MDHESTYSHAPAWYVSHDAQICGIDLVGWLEAKREPLSTQPTLSAPRFSGRTDSEFTANGASSPGPQEDFVNTQDDRDLQVRVERSIVLNARQEDSESIEKDTNAPRSVWDISCTV
jgi:hypothetical protein